MMFRRKDGVESWGGEGIEIYKQGIIKNKECAGTVGDLGEFQT